MMTLPGYGMHPALLGSHPGSYADMGLAPGLGPMGPMAGGWAWAGGCVCLARPLHAWWMARAWMYRGRLCKAAHRTPSPARLPTATAQACQAAWAA